MVSALARPTRPALWPVAQAMHLLAADQAVAQSEPLGTFRLLGVVKSLLFADVTAPTKRRPAAAGRSNLHGETPAESLPHRARGRVARADSSPEVPEDTPAGTFSMPRRSPGQHARQAQLSHMRPSSHAESTRSRAVGTGAMGTGDVGRTRAGVYRGACAETRPRAR
jgi:hypothetical protein